jgi:predicted patatin/cPLA2 family phospholipase
MANGGPALVLEGGGFRGIFTAGVLDVMQEHGIYGFGSVWGVSAGAINATSFKSRQIGRCMFIIMAFRDDRRFMSLCSWTTTGDMVGADFMYDEVQNRLDPCDNETFNANPMRMYAVATDTVFGTPAYLPCRSFPEDVVHVRASASLPLVSNRVEVDGHLYLDGGTADSIPYAVAMGLEGAPQVVGHTPADKAVVVLTRERGYVKTDATERLYLRSHRYDGFPYYTEALASRAERYNASRKRLFELEEQGRVLVIEPPRPVEVGNTGADGASLLDLYLQGRSAATEKLAELRAFAG